MFSHTLPLALQLFRASPVLDPPTLRYFATGKIGPLKVEADVAAAAGVHWVDITDEAASQDKFSPTTGVGAQNTSVSEEAAR